MTRNLILGAAATFALAFSPFTPKVSADWQAYYDQLSKLESGPEKLRDSATAIGDKIRAGQQKRADNSLDALDRARAVQEAWLYRNAYRGYYYQPYGSGVMPWYGYQTVPASPGSSRP